MPFGIETMKGFESIFILYFVIAYFTGWWPFQADEWTGYVYPNRSNLTNYQSIGSFDNFLDCQSSAIYKLRSLDKALTGDYECGLN